MNAPTTKSLMTIFGVAADVNGPVDFPAGTYQVRLRIAEDDPCGVQVNATGISMTVTTLGTTA